MTFGTRILALALFAMLTAGCSSTVRYALLGTREHATTEGEAQLHARDDGRLDLEVSVDRLPPLRSLGEDKTAYVLFVQPDGAETPTRACVLVLDPSTRTGRCTSVIDRGRIAIRITAEATAEAEAPSDAIIVASILEPTD